jgi:prefoldin subunit 5
MMSLADKIKKKLAEEALGDLESQINELRVRFDALLSELKELNNNLRAIRQLLQKLAKEG